MKILSPSNETNFVGCIDEFDSIFLVVSPIAQVGLKIRRVVLQYFHCVLLLLHREPHHTRRACLMRVDDLKIKTRNDGPFPQ